MTKIAELPLSDEAIVRGVQTNDASILDRFIKEYSPRIAKFLKGLGAKENDLEDIAMTTLTAAFNNIRKEGFELKTALSTYVFQIAKFQFFKILDRKKMVVEPLPEGRDFLDDKDFLKDLEQAESTNLLWEKFHQLGEGCKQVLNLWLEKVPMSEIAEKCGIPSEVAARVKKFKCLNKLKETIWGDPRFAGILV